MYYTVEIELNKIKDTLKDGPTLNKNTILRKLNLVWKKNSTRDGWWCLN